MSADTFIKTKLLLISTIVGAGMSASAMAADSIDFLPYFGTSNGSTPLQIFSDSFKNGFDTSCIVFIGSDPCLNIQVVSPKEIDCTTPAGAGSVKVSVSCFDGRSAASSQTYGFYGPLALKEDAYSGLPGSKVQLTAAGGLPPYHYSASPSQCATIDEATGTATVLNGCKNSYYGQINFAVQDSIGGTANAEYRVTNTVSLDLSALFVAVGQKFSITPQGGQEPYKYEVVSGPVTVSDNGSGVAGSVGGEFTIRVTDALGQKAEASQRVVDHGFVLDYQYYYSSIHQDLGIGGDYMGRPRPHQFFRSKSGHLIFAAATNTFSLDPTKNVEKQGPSYLSLIDIGLAKEFTPVTYGSNTPGSDSFGDAIELGNGKFILAGATFHSPAIGADTTRATLVRANADLTSDTSFGNAGRSFLSVQPKGLETVESVIEESSGKLLLAVSSCIKVNANDANCEFYFVRVSAEGKQEESIAVVAQDQDRAQATLVKLPGGDVLMVVNTSTGAQAYKIKEGSALTSQNIAAVSSLNKIMAGYVFMESREDGAQALFRFLPMNSNGSAGLLSVVQGGELNPHFGDGKSIVTPQTIDGGILKILDYALQQDGGIFILPAYDRAPVLRLSADGKLDPNYSKEGQGASLNGDFNYLVPTLDQSQADIVLVNNYFNVVKVQL
jgi:hypothetical protein